MTDLLAFGYVMSLVATILAWPVARLRPEHAPIAYLLTFGFASDLARRGIHRFIFIPAYATLKGAPATGWIRLAVGVEQTLFLGWFAGVAAVAMVVFLKRRPWPVAIGYVASVLGIAVFGYPALRGDLLRQAYFGFDLLCLMAAVGCLLHWIAFYKETPRPCHLIVMLIIGAELAGLIGGAWRFGIFTTWKLEQVSYTMLYSVVAVINGGVLWIQPRSTRS
jgi:hypothetical protein